MSNCQWKRGLSSNPSWRAHGPVTYLNVFFNENLVQPFRSGVLELIRIRIIWMVCYNRFAGSHLSVGFPGGTVVKNLPANAGGARDTRSIPGLGRSPGEGYGSPLHYSCLENPMDRGAWRAIQSMGLPRVGHNWAHPPHTHTPATHTPHHTHTHPTTHTHTPPHTHTPHLSRGSQSHDWSDEACTHALCRI